MWNPLQSLPHNAAPTTWTYDQALIPLLKPCALLIHPTTNWRIMGHKSFIAFNRRPSSLVLERIVKSLTTSKSTIRHFWSVERALAQRSSGDDKAHPFWLFHRKTRPNSHSTRHCLFLSILASINRGWISKFSTLLDTIKETHSHTHKFLIFFIPILIFSQGRVFRFQR